MVLVILLYALCASSFTICKAVLQYSKPFFFVGLRMIIAGILLYGYAFFQQQHLKIKKSDIGLLIQLILFHIYFAYTLDLWALQSITSFKSSLFFNLSSFVTALLSYLLFKERLTKMQMLGLMIGFLGFLPELIARAPQEEQFGSFLFISLPELVMFGSVFSSCYGWITLKRLLIKTHASPMLLNGIAMLAGGVLALATSFILEDHLVDTNNIILFLKLTFLIILIINIIFYNLYGYLLKHYSATFLSFAGFLTPLWAALFGRLFLGEQIQVTFFISFFFVMVGLYIFYRDELKKITSASH